MISGLFIYFWYMRDAIPLGDEKEHIPQISRFLNWKFTARPGLGMPPVYHFLVFVGLAAMDGSYVHDVRLVSFLGAALCVPAFYWVAQKLVNRKTALLRTVQFTFLPIVFYLFPLVYTDIWALLPVLLMVGAALDRRPTLSCALAVIATVFRQTNIVWAGFVWLLFLFQEPNRPNLSVKNVLSWLRRTWSFVALFSAFIIFTFVNHGIAIGAGARKSLSFGFSLANIWFFLLLFCVFFVPQWWNWLRDILSLTRKAPLWAGLAVALGIPAIFFTYKATHPFNSAVYSFYLRNRLLAWTTHGLPHQLLAASIILLGLFGILRTRFTEKRFALIIPIGFASIYLMPFIEQRYYIEFLVLYLLLRSEEPTRAEATQAVLFVATSAALTAGIVNGCFLL